MTYYYDTKPQLCLESAVKIRLTCYVHFVHTTKLCLESTVARAVCNLFMSIRLFITGFAVLLYY